MAGAIDLVLVGGLDVVVVLLTLRIAELPLDAASTLSWPPLAAFLLWVDGGYVVALTALGGQTIGKMVCGIRVVTGDGRTPTFGQALVRTVVGALSLAPLGAGWVVAAIAGGATFQDRAAGTEVVRR